MLVGIIISLVYYGKKSIKLASILAGIGWGFFIDEIGKYLTRDNNYWFRPAIIFIYISFILLFFLYRFLEKKSRQTRSSLWHEILEDCEELADNDLEITEKKELLQKIDKFKRLSSSPKEKKLLLNLRSLVISTVAKKDKKTFNLSRLVATTLRVTYNRLFKKKLVFYALFTYSLWYIIDKSIDSFRLFFNSNKLLILQDYYSHYDFFSKADVYMVTLKFIIEGVVAVFFAVGLVYWLRGRTIKGIRFYQWGLLINIFIGSHLKFYFEQFSGVFSLILAFVVWTWLDKYRREISSILHRPS
ncbi:TPA: hypothetical protein DD455_00075 [Candidatus Shapirobacteria bacterium]|nr:hypothetical protein [Candidatus Shapirobacteria bacterium]